MKQFKHIFVLVFLALLCCSSFLAQGQYYYEDDYLCYLLKFKRIWTSQAIKVPPTRSGNIGLIDFARAFARTYRDDNYITNEILEFFVDQEGYMRKNEEYMSVNYKPQNGYFSIGYNGDGDWLEMCYWKRDNGHSLVAINWSKEIDCDAYFTVFYDFDPNLSQLIPEVYLTHQLELKYGKLAHYELNPFTNVSVTLPKTGKNIIVHEYETETDYTLHWNGMTFDELEE